VHRTRAASGDTAAEFRAGQFEMLTENPEKRRIRFDIDLLMLAIYYEGDHLRSPYEESFRRKAVV
jgi:hypothetical protein